MILAVIFSLLPSKLRLALLKLRGHEIGTKVKLGFGAILKVDGKIHLGQGCKVGHFVLIKSNELKIAPYTQISSFSFIQTPRITIGRDSKISSAVIIRSGHVSRDSELILGDLVHIFPFVTIDSSRKVKIGDETGIGPHCSIFTHASYKSVLQGYPVTYGDVTIGKRVELTYNVFVAPGVNIADDAICAYGSYINKDIPAGVLAAGLPAIVKRSKDQITACQVDVSQTLDGIIENYTANVQMITGRKPLLIKKYLIEEARIMDNDMIYVICDAEIKVCTAARYGLFDITGRSCENHGLQMDDFDGFRKFLSRYGIRFLTKTEFA